MDQRRDLFGCFKGSVKIFGALVFLAAQRTVNEGNKKNNVDLFAALPAVRESPPYHSAVFTWILEPLYKQQDVRTDVSDCDSAPNHLLRFTPINKGANCPKLTIHYQRYLI